MNINTGDGAAARVAAGALRHRSHAQVLDSGSPSASSPNGPPYLKYTDEARWAEVAADALDAFSTASIMPADIRRRPSWPPKSRPAEATAAERHEEEKRDGEGMTKYS